MESLLKINVLKSIALIINFDILAVSNLASLSLLMLVMFLFTCFEDFLVFLFNLKSQYIFIKNENNAEIYKEKVKV
jgi:hypothetical protein